MSYDLLNKVANGKLVFRSEPLTGGLNNRFQAQYIGNNQAAELFNVDLDDVARPKLRDGYQILGTTLASMQATITSSLLDDRIAGAAYLHTSFATKKLLIAIDDGASGKCYYRSDVSVAGSWTEAQFSSGASYAVNTSEAVIFQANDGLVIIPAASSKIASMNSAGVLFTSGGGTANLNPPTGCVDGCYMLNRIFLLKAGTTTTPPEIHYSKLLPDMTSLSTQFNQDGASIAPTIAGRLQVSPNWGGEAIAIKPWSDVSLMAFFNNCIEEILVFSSNPQGGSNRRVIEPRWGCCSRDSVVTVGSDMYFADQFAQIRSLTQTVAEQTGVAPPISEPISAEIPGKVNLQYRNKIRSVAFKERMYVAYPRLGATEANAIAVFHLGRKIWESIWLFKNAIGHWFISDIRGSGDELWFTDGGTGASTAAFPEACKVFRMFPGLYSDDGGSIRYVETSKAYDFESPELDKIGETYEIEARGSDKVKVETGVRFDEDSGFTDLEGALIVSKSGSSFPILSTDFPLTPSDFPLVDAAPGLARMKQSLYGLPSDAALNENSRGRTIQVQITVQETAKQFQRAGYRITARACKHERENMEP